MIQGCRLFVRRMVVLVMLMACSMNVSAQITTYYVEKGDVTLNGVNYYLYETHWYIQYSNEDFVIGNVASVHQFNSNVPEEVVIPKTVSKDGVEYPVSSVRYDYKDGYARWRISSNRVKVIKFEGPIGFHHGIYKEAVFNLPNLTDIYFNEKTPVGNLEGWPYAELFESPDSLTITVHSKDLTKARADSLRQQAPWSGFKKIIGCSPTRLLLTAGAGGKDVEVWNDEEMECALPPTGGTIWEDISKTENIQLRIPTRYLDKVIINGDDVTTTLPSSTPSDPAYEGYIFYTLTDFNDVVAVEVRFNEVPEIIAFEDPNVKAICVGTQTGWDTDHDGELSIEEAAAVTTLTVGGTLVFKGNTSITSFDELRYFTGLNEIEGESFRGCSNLKKITFPEGVTKIGSFAFDATSVTSIRIPESVTYIQGYAFRGCRSLKKLTLPEGLQTLGSQAFNNCGLVFFEVPASVTSVNSTATSGPNLISVSVDPANTKYDSRGDCNAIINTSTNELIVGCKYTKIPEGVVKIGGYAFVYSPIEAIEIPSSVTFIDYGAFSYSKLKSVVCKGTTPPTLSSTQPFSNISSECKLIVPTGTRQAYIDAGWTEDFFRGGILDNDDVKCDINDDGNVSIGDVTTLVNKVLEKTE